MKIRKLSFLGAKQMNITHLWFLIGVFSWSTLRIKLERLELLINGAFGSIVLFLAIKITYFMVLKRGFGSTLRAKLGQSDLLINRASGAVVLFFGH